MFFPTCHRPARVALLGALALTLCAAPTDASGSAAPAAKPVPAPMPGLAPLVPQPAPIVYGLVAFLDPETGQLTGPISSLVPPADLRFSQPVLLPEPQQLPSGGWVLDLMGTCMESYVIHIDPFGRREVSCVQGHTLPAKGAHAPARRAEGGR